MSQAATSLSGSRGGRELPRYGWFALGALGLAAAYHHFPTRFEGAQGILSAIALVLGLLAIRWLWRKPPALTLSAAIALSIFSGSWGQLGLSGLPLNRLLVALAFLEVLLRSPGAANLPPIKLRGLHLLMLAAIVYAVVSAVAASALGSSEAIFELVDVFGIAPFLAFVVAPAVFAGESERRLLLLVLSFLGLYLGLTAIFEIIGPHSLVFPSYIAESDELRPGVLRAGGPFQSPVGNGFALFACAIASLMTWLKTRDRGLRLMALIAGAIASFGCFLTLERGVWIAGAGAVFAAAMVTRTGRRWLLPGTAICALVIGAALLASSALSQKTSERVAAQQSVWDRQNQTATGLRMIKAKPLAGFGWTRYEEESLDYFRQPADYPMTGYTPVVTIGLPAEVLPLHNTYLAYGVEIGLLGLALWMLCWGIAVLTSVAAPGPSQLRPWKLGLLALAVFFLVIGLFDPHKQPFPMLLLLTWAGIAFGAGPRVASQPGEATVPEPPGTIQAAYG
jgi:putative inorganic carbon (hco3(-)) transporter